MVPAECPGRGRRDLDRLDRAARADSGDREACAQGRDRAGAVGGLAWGL